MLLFYKFYKLLHLFQECIAEKKDWRQCQQEVKEFRGWLGLVTGFTLGVLSATAWRYRGFWRGGAKALPKGNKSRSSARDYKMVLVVRNDLGMGKGKIAAQCCHATLGCYRIASTVAPTMVEEWEVAGQPKIVLRLDTAGEEGLYALLREARTKGVAGTVVRDAGHTQVERGTATVAGLGPCDTTTLDQITGHLKLL
ncbi:hypothetical protein AAG570_001980 [Ranatra chinensis]|uniref:peptidyl-tRNA hydrolase n=1 Tax=Ranatra chinensis TaxID=642074 RepID=A0ABD0YA24_9HEMI